MLTSEAHVETDRPSRYLVQLCRHFNHQGRHLRYRPRTHHGGEEHVRAEGQAHVEWSDTHGTVNFGWGQCIMQATADTLTLRAEAADEETLQRIQDLLTGHLDRFGRRDHLKVSWLRPQAPTVQPGDATRAAPAPTTAAVARRKRHRTIGLTAVGALAIAVHLGLGGAALASPWTGLAADIVLAVVGVKVVAVTVIALRLAIRRRRTDKAPRVRGQDGGGTVTKKPITRSEARVPTPRGERYAKQLCSHAAWKTPRAEWAPPDGVIEFPDDMGTCRITAEPDQLVLAVEATDPAISPGCSRSSAGTSSDSPGEKDSRWNGSRTEIVKHTAASCAANANRAGKPWKPGPPAGSCGVPDPDWKRPARYGIPDLQSHLDALDLPGLAAHRACLIAGHHVGPVRRDGVAGCPAAPSGPAR